MKLAALVITHNSERHVAACLAACLRWREQFPAGILVIDNASRDGTCARVEAFPEVRLVRNGENRGFAGAVNQGFRLLGDADAVLILNPDVELISSPEPLARALEETPGAGAAGGLLLGRDGKPQRGFVFRRLPDATALCLEILGVNRLWPGNPANRRWRALDLPYDRPARSIQPPGACLLIRREAWGAVEGFDEAFHPVWFEDVDFICRLLEAGRDTVYTPAFRAVHEGGHSVLRLPWDDRQLYWYRNLLRYVSRHFRLSGRVLACLSVIAGLCPRVVTGMLVSRSLGPLRIYGRLVRLAVRTAVSPAERACAPRPEDNLRDPVRAPGRPGI
jgi:N-acetylglucosaminyl-diphospho-decaprenol L-rhamnosyltransferase